MLVLQGVARYAAGTGYSLQVLVRYAAPLWAFRYYPSRNAQQGRLCLRGNQAVRLLQP